MCLQPIAATIGAMTNPASAPATTPATTPADNEIVPDDKDWTWVLERPCPECGYDAAAIVSVGLPALLRESAEPWGAVLSGEHATDRPRAGVWSPTEYACHVRDMHRIFGERVGLMRTADPNEGARFDNWDQDAAAIESDYASQDPAVVLTELVAAAEQAAGEYAAVAEDDWQRRGLRSNGSAFTIETIGRYHLHDAVHHLWDVHAK